MPVETPSIMARGTAAVFTALLRLARASWKQQTLGMDVIHQALERKERLLVVFWHAKYISLFPLMEGFDTCLLTSRSFRGQVITALSRHFGYHCLTLDKKHGSEMLKLLDGLLRKHQSLAIAVDGPLGPLHRVRPSLVRLAARLELLVVPVSVAAKPKIVLRQRWDKMEIPLPFSRIQLGIGRPFKIPREVQPQEIEKWIESIRVTIEKTDQMVEKL